MTDNAALPELAASLRRLRQETGLSGIEAARRAGLSQSTVSRLETGRRAPTVNEVTALCKAYRTEFVHHPKLRLGVIRWDRPLTMHARHAFHLYDTHTVIVGTESGTAFITDSVEVAAYDRRFAELEAVAVFDDHAVGVFERIADDYRNLGQRQPDCRDYR